MNQSEAINLMPILLALIIGIIVFFILVGQIKRLFLIRRAKSKRLDSLKPGLVILKGVVSNNSPSIKSPISKKMCYWYDYTVEQYITNPNRMRKREWKIIGFSRKDTIFSLDYSFGQCLVATFGAEVDLKNEESWLTSALPSLPTEPTDDTSTLSLTKINPVKDRSLISWLFSLPPPLYSYRITEKKIELENLVTVVGYYQELDVRQIDTMLEQNKNTNAFIQEYPPQREIMLKIKEYLLQNNKNSISIISRLSPKKEKLIISSASLKGLVLRYIINIIVCLIISVAVWGYLFYFFNNLFTF